MADKDLDYGIHFTKTLLDLDITFPLKGFFLIGACLLYVSVEASIVLQGLTAL